tara:strand:- start:1139 stop:2455 length:1317 start_codon:yes stop_codon:yes gene_type:complete
MAVPTLTPVSTTSKVILTSTGSTTTVGNGAGSTTHYPFGMYVTTTSALYDTNFISGAADQVAYTYKKLGGDVLDIELTVGNVYAAYEESVLEYTYHVNKHQAKNVLGSLLGFATGTFDHDGQMTGGDASGSAVNLAFPKFKVEYARKVGEGFAEEAGIGGDNTFYSASFALTAGVQDYDLQAIISKSAADNYDQAEAGGPVPYADLVGNRKVKIQRVFYKTPGAMWRFYGYYGGLNVVGNLNYYGQYSDDTTFEIVPVWQNKLQSMAYEDHLFTRLSHYSYELFNNKLRIFPIPHGFVPFMHVQFTIDSQPWTEDADRKNGTDGINNMSTLPFDNIPYENINAIGKHWIRRYALSLCKEMLGQIRGKFGGGIPIPGDNVTLNSGDLLSQAKEEQDYLKEELKTILDEMTYKALAQQDAEKIEAIDKVNGGIPLMIYQG